MNDTLVGIFVGGQSRRMGSPKGLLAAPDSTDTLLDRLILVSSRALPEAPIVLLGRHPAYARWPNERLEDAVEGVGPIAGLLSLVRLARVRGYRAALALACDMPHLSVALLRRLAHGCPAQVNLAARVEGRWQPFFARYSPRGGEAAVLALMTRQRFSMSGVLDAIRARPLPLHPQDAWQLGDWDTPADVVKPVPR